MQTLKELCEFAEDMRSINQTYTPEERQAEIQSARFVRMFFAAVEHENKKERMHQGMRQEIHRIYGRGK